jgi:hypothetical protein
MCGGGGGGGARHTALSLRVLMCVLCVNFVCLMCGSCVSHVCLMCVLSVTFVCLMCVSCVSPVCLLCVSCVSPVCLMFVSCVSHVCLVCVSCVSRVCLVCVSCVSDVCGGGGVLGFDVFRLQRSYPHLPAFKPAGAGPGQNSLFVVEILAVARFVLPQVPNYVPHHAMGIACNRIGEALVNCVKLANRSVG